MMRPGKNYINSNIRLTIALKNSGCELVDTETVVLKLMSPTGVDYTFTYDEDSNIERAAQGYYTADFTPDEAGRWHYRWETTDNGGLYDVAEEGDFLVQQSRFYGAQRELRY
jgi:hypothetical protein